MSAVEVQGLSLRLGTQQVLRDASLRLERGEVGVLTGPSGSGKSTLLKLLLGLRPRAASLELRGEARALGQDALRTPTPVLARRAGLLFQDARLQLTQPDVLGELRFRPENLGLDWRDVEERVERLARRFELGPLLGRSVAGLSGGETKRVALAAVLAAGPELLLLDEPLGGLDARWRGAVLRDLARERGRATLIVEHRTGALAPLRPVRWEMRDGAPAPARPRERPERHASPRRDAARGPPVVEVAELTVRLGGATLLHQVHLEAGPGVTVLAGPNGAGKTTLLRALLGLVPFEGRARVAGLDPVRESRWRLARVVGYVPQRAEDLFFAASAQEELAFAPRNVHGAVDGMQLAALARDLGLEALLGRHPLTLSGGEQQRLALGCALAHGPRVLLLDEPTVGLDAPGLARVLDRVRRARRGAAVLIATHDPEVHALADRVVWLRDGRLAPGPLEAAA